MLEALREGTRGWIAWVIIGLLCIPFALWGIGNYTGLGSSPNDVAEVNGASITQTDLNQAYQSQLEQLRQTHGSDYTPDDTDAMRKSVLDDLIGNSLLKQQAAKSGYRVGDQQLVSRIHGMQAFDVGGKFNLKVYRTRLQQTGYTAQGFENSVRQDLEVGQLRLGIAGSALATGQEFDHFVALSGEQRKIGYATVPVDKYLGHEQPSEDAIKAWYQDHKQAFMAPETVTIAYIELDADKLAKNIPVDEDALHSLYQEKKASFVKREQRKAAHILIAPKGKGKEALSKAKAKAESVLKKLHNGASFKKLAKQYSDDAGSAKKGGDLGWIQHGDLAKPFEKALYGVGKVGGVVGPVKTQYGYHIIKLEGIRKPRQKSFKEVRDKLVKDYREKKAADKFYKLGNKLGNLAFDHSDSLEPIHKALDLPIQHVAGVTREQGEGIAADPKIRDAAFSDEVHKNEKNHLVKLGDTNVVVLRDSKSEPAHLKALRKVKPQIVKTLRQRAAAKKTESVAQGIATAVRQGTDLKKAADGFKVEAPAFVGRGDQSVPRPILKAAFEGKAPGKGAKPSVGTVALESGDQAVYVLAGAKPGDAKSVPNQQKQILVRQLVASHARADLAAYVRDLREHADVDVKNDAVANY